MARLNLIIAPDPRLSKVSAPVLCVDGEIRQLMNDMMETMYHNSGAGLAAPQVGVNLRVIVMDVSPNVSLRDGENEEESLPPFPLKMANPQILWRSTELDCYAEGCLSIPDQFVEVFRPKDVRVRYVDENNTTQELEVSGYLAKCIQHEIDHLDGILTYDHQSALKKSIILRRLAKTQRSEEGK